MSPATQAARARRIGRPRALAVNVRGTANLVASLIQYLSAATLVPAAVAVGYGETPVPFLAAGAVAVVVGTAVERATQRLQATYDALVGRGVAGRVQLDLSLLRDLGYYTGAIVEIYDPALGHILGWGGRYDELLGRFGRPLPAAGFGLYLERVHLAQMEEERLMRGRSGGEAEQRPVSGGAG